MLTFAGHRIFLIVEATDMRRSFNGLAGRARELLDATPTWLDSAVALMPSGPVIRSTMRALKPSL